ncbi:MAG: peptidoglycan DD-metalloendopeptidase family protein [Synergistaceae bacterium]|nr:peptidoglycan DD-metalloendopeptidase family protein [Synergistaceae bacterium]
MRVERYQQQVAEGAVPSAFLRSYANGSAGQVPAAWGQLSGPIREWGLWLKEREDKWDAATVMNAQTEFARRMSDWLDNPETGQTVTRKGGAARGLNDDTDAYADKVAREISGRLENDQQRAIFNSGIAKAKQPYMRQASTHEAREREVYRKQAFDANMAAANDLYLKSENNPEARRQAVDMAANAIRSQYFGAPEEYIDRAIDETKSGMAAQWVAKVAQDNPRAALEMLKDESLGLLPETRNKLEAQIKPRAEIYERQLIIDDLVQRYHSGQEMEGLKYIREYYEGEERERLVSAYKTRMNELEIDQNNARRLRAQAQEDFFDNLYRRTVQGETFTKAQLDQMYLDGKLSEQRHNYAVNNWIIAAGNRAKIEKRIFAENPEIPQAELDARVMREMGTTDEEYKQTFVTAAHMASLGQLKEDAVDALYKRGKLTASDVERLKGQLKTWDKAQGVYYQNELTNLKQYIRSLTKDAGLPDGLEEATVISFITQAGELDMRAPDYRKALFELKKNVLLDMMDNSGTPLKYKGFFGGTYYTALGDEANNVKDSRFEDKKLDPFPLLPKLAPSEVELEHGGEELSAPAAVQATGDIIKDVLGGKSFPVTSGYDPKRKLSSHYAIDIGAPAGTPVHALPLGVDWHVDTMGTNARSNAGLNMTLSTEVNGHEIKMTVMHLQPGSMKYKTGDTVKGGAAIAAVGNTGRTKGHGEEEAHIWEPGRTAGAHLHLAVMVGGKAINPQKLYEIIGIDGVQKPELGMGLFTIPEPPQTR